MLPFVMLAYNSSVYESTWVTPAIAICGYRWTCRLGTCRCKKPKGCGIHLENLRAHRPCARAREGQYGNAAAMAECRYDRHANESFFRQNDCVWLAVPRRRKLYRSWERPYMIIGTTAETQPETDLSEVAPPGSSNITRLRRNVHHIVQLNHQTTWRCTNVFQGHQTAGTYLVLHTETESVLIVNNTLDRISDQDSVF
ncbi:hypothetical protein T03_17018, partial [Trichinella britovi]